MEMALIKDVEQPLPESEDQQPLLASNGQSHRLPSPRPQNLPAFQNRWPLQDPNHHDNTPTSVNTSPNDTPLTTPTVDAHESWPKKWRRSDRRLRRLNTELLEAIDNKDCEEVERLLNNGANPNATCRMDLVSACHLAALTGGDSLSLLLKYGAEKHRLDKLGRTPLHLAAWAGNARQVAVLLDFPEDIQDRVSSENMSSEAEEDVRRLCPKTKLLANMRLDIGEVQMLLPKTWKDNIDHDCKDISGTLPILQTGWTPLHVAASCARRHCTRLLLAAGADPNICDVEGRTPLDVAGSGFYYDEEIDSDNFTEVIRMLTKVGGRFNTMKTKGLQNVDTPLHTAVNLENLDAINELLEAGANVSCRNTNGETPLHVCVKREFEDGLQILANYTHSDADPLSATVDVKDSEGHTVLQAAIEAAWLSGVCVALEAGADVTLKAKNGETPIHSAAALGDLDVFTEILSVAKQKDAIDFQNAKGETALFKAIQNGHLECVRAILSEGASITITLPGDVNVLHVAAEHGHAEILKELIEFDEDKSKEMLNSLTDGGQKGSGPIHFAIINNHLSCVELLLSKNADIRLRTTCSPGKSSTPLHIASLKNLVDIAKLILKFDKTTIHEVNSMGWYPLHTAAHHGSRDVIKLLLYEGADLSGSTDGPKKYRKTAIDYIINNLSQPKEFLEEIFDSYITANTQNIQDTTCVITVDYRVLMPTTCEMEQMKIIERLIKTGNRYGQRKLLIHPLIESFLYLKWKALLPFFYTIIAVYALFVSCLTVFVVSVFFYKDTLETKPNYLDSRIWGYMTYASIILVLLQELIYMNIKSSRYFFQLETWVKFGSVGFAAILPASVLVTSWFEAEWPRHVATAALLLSWLEMMFLLSRFPNWGYYVLMFGKVATNVVKILLTFAFLVIGFSLSFMIQFHSHSPFEGPLAALLKTIVMMTSEFDYMTLFDEEHTTGINTSIYALRIVFLIFLVLAAIVLMNLLVGVAVNDINDLEVLGNIRRLAKQVEFLGTLDILVYNKLFKAILPRNVNKSLKTKRKVAEVLTLCPGKPRWRSSKILPSHIRDAIYTKAQQQKKLEDDAENSLVFRKKLNEIYEAVVVKNISMPVREYSEEKHARNRSKLDEILRHLNDLDGDMSEMRKQITSCTERSIDRSPIDELNNKVDKIQHDILSIKLFLSKLERHLT